MKYFIPILCLFVLIACTKTITPPLNNVSQIVIEGAVSDTTGPYHVNITKTTNFYNDNVYPTVSGATVMITDSNTRVTDVLRKSMLVIISHIH